MNDSYLNLSFILSLLSLKKKDRTNTHVRKNNDSLALSGWFAGELISGEPGLCLTRVRKMDSFDLTGFKSDAAASVTSEIHTNTEESWKVCYGLEQTERR